MALLQTRQIIRVNKGVCVCFCFIFFLTPKCDCGKGTFEYSLHIHNNDGNEHLLIDHLLCTRHSSLCCLTHSHSSLWKKFSPPHKESVKLSNLLQVTWEGIGRSRIGTQADWLHISFEYFLKVSSFSRVLHLLVGVKCCLGSEVALQPHVSDKLWVR